MFLAVLGPLRVNGHAWPGGARDRVVLSVLIMRRNTAVPADTLADAIWAEDQPASRDKVIQGAVVRLRKQLGAQAIESLPGGYRLVIEDTQLDVAVMQSLVEEADRSEAQGDTASTLRVLDLALDTWRGDPFPDLIDWDPARAESERLCELREYLLEQRLAAAIESGRADTVPDARSLVSSGPERERRWLLMARALYSVDRQQEALETIREGARRLRRDLGLDPSEEFGELERAILRRDPSLPFARSSPSARRDRKRRVVVVALSVAWLLGLAIALGSPAAAGLFAAHPAPSVRPVPPRPEAGEPWIVFTRAESTGLTNTFLARPDGSDAQRLLAVSPVDDAHIQNPDWSPDGRQVAFEVLGAGPGTTDASVWTVAIAGGTPREIASCSSSPCRQFSQPAWSPDGRSLATVRFDLYPDGGCCRSYLDVVDVDSGHIRTVFSITQDPPDTSYDVIYTPTWSPDGSAIAFTLESYGRSDPYPFIGSRIAVVSAIGDVDHVPRFITPLTLDGYRPDWSPSGDRIVFSTDDPQQFASYASSDIYSVRADGSDLRKLTDSRADGSVRYLMPSWSPDGRAILLSIGVVGSGGVLGGQYPASMPAAGGTPTRLGDFRGNDVGLRPTG